MRAVLTSPTPDSAILAQLVRVKGLVSAGIGGSPVDVAEAIGSPRLQRLVKAAVGALSTDDAEVLADRAVVIGAFIELAKQSSAFYRLLSDGAVRIPLRSSAQLQTLEATAWIVGEGKPVPLTRAGWEVERLSPQFAAAMLVVTKQLLQSTQSEGSITRALRLGVGHAVDAAFFAGVIDGDTEVIASSGSGAENAVTDLRALLDAVEPTGASRLLWVMDATQQRHAAMLTTTGGEFIFPDLTPTGGSIRGIPAMPSDTLGAGKVALVDATGIAADAQDVEIDTSESATLEMLNASLQQSAVPTVTPANQVSMFTTNSVAIKALASFGFQRMRDNAVAVVESVDWAPSEES